MFKSNEIFKFNHKSSNDRYEKLIPLQNIKHYLQEFNIECEKYNYSFDDNVQNRKHYEAKICLSKDGQSLLIYNRKLYTMPNGTEV